MAVVRIHFDPAPLIDAATRRWLMRKPDPPGLGQLAPMLGVTYCTVRRWVRCGKVRIDVAEDAADAIGLLPSELWPDYWDRILDYYGDRELIDG